MKFEFEHTWGGKDNWYTKSKRWAKKKSPFISHLILGVIEWLYCKWIDAKIDNTMRDVDAQTKQILEDWDEPKREPLIICLLYTSPSPRDKRQSRMPSSA